MHAHLNHVSRITSRFGSPNEPNRHFQHPFRKLSSAPSRISNQIHYSNRNDPPVCLIDAPNPLALR